MTMDDGACLYYKLTNEPKGSGELKKELFEAFSPKFSSDKMFLSNNSDQTCLPITLTSAGRC